MNERCKAALPDGSACDTLAADMVQLSLTDRFNWPGSRPFYAHIHLCAEHLAALRCAQEGGAA